MGLTRDSILQTREVMVAAKMTRTNLVQDLVT